MDGRVWIQQKITILWVNHRHCSCLHLVITVDFHLLDGKYFLDRTKSSDREVSCVSFLDENVMTDDTWNKLHEKLLRPALLSRKIKSSKESLNIALSLYTGILSVLHKSLTIFCHLFHAWAKGDFGVEEWRKKLWDEIFCFSLMHIQLYFVPFEGSFYKKDILCKRNCPHMCSLQKMPSEHF